jgi:peptidoglycan hydrolase FlgJ
LAVFPPFTTLSVTASLPQSRNLPETEQEDMQMDFASIPPPRSGPAPSTADLQRTARALETAFLSEMLKAAGTARPAEGMDGGPGEAQFASFMADAQARALVAAGGLGLTDAIATALAERAGGGDA